MATYIEHRPLVVKAAPLDPARVFQRGHGAAAVKAGRRKRVLRVGHVLVLTVFLAGLFFALNRAYLFLISWEELTVRKIELSGGRDSVRGTLKAFLGTRPIGNILLCDISLLQLQLKSYPWVKDARIQKVFPATLKIEIEERQPLALLEKDGLALVDGEATTLERPAAADAWPGLPVVRDEAGFRDNFWEKWRTAAACLASLTPEERTRLAVLECSEDGRISLEFREDPVRVILDGTAVRTRLDRFAGLRADLEARLGPLEYADLRLGDRIIVRPRDPAPGAPPAKSPKESE